MKDTDYIVIQAPMVSDLKLSGNRLIIYALIHGFCKDGEHKFNGSINYICDWTNLTRNTVIATLKSLVKDGLILRQEQNINNVKFCSYTIGSAKIAPVVQKECECGAKNDIGSSAKITPNNINIDGEVDNNINNNISIVESDDEFAERMYKLYPTKCPVRGVSLGKTYKNKTAIRSLLKLYSKEDIERVFRLEIKNKLGKYRMRNFSTFLNQFPDPSAICENTNEGFGDLFEQAEKNKREELLLKRFYDILGSEEAIIYGIDPNVWYTMDEKAKNYHRAQPQKKEKLLKWIREHDNG